MDNVDIYIEISKMTPAPIHRKYMYLLETKRKDGTPVTRESLEEIDATLHQASLYAVNAALARMTRPCHITIHMQDQYIGNMTRNLQRWKETGYKTAKGTLIKDAEEWETFSIYYTRHDITFVVGQHSYTSWMQGEMRK